MITNKYESPPNNYQSLKEQRLRQIQEDYFPPPYKSSLDKFFKRQPVYTNTADYTHSFETENLFHRDFEVRNSVAANITGLVLSVLFMLIPVLATIVGDNPGYFFFIFSLIGLWPAIYCVKNILNKKPRLTLTEKGMYFMKNNISITWEQVIAAHILKEDSGDDTTYKLVTDYIDEQHGDCKVESFVIVNYDKDDTAIAAAIEYKKRLWRF
jgi:hypothetical protein